MLSRSTVDCGWTTADEHLSDQDGRSSWSAPAGAVVALWVLALAAAGWLADNARRHRW
ncbi:hypothetical protein HBB16_04840 [Pseudonocardia sp. MCCB 268]|nr:hypothetical protein [Pseudonocardia cytotoxica]